MIYVVLILMIYMQIYIETNLINWVFFILNTVSFALLIRANTNVASIELQLKVANFIKFYSLIVMVADILFISFVGYDPDNQQAGNLYIKENYPNLHNNMTIIGFRSGNVDSSVSKEKILQFQFLTYVVYFMLAIYLCSYFEDQRKVSQGDENFGEDDYKRLFEFNMNTEKTFDDLEVDVTNSVYKKKSEYSYRDLIDFYENIRFTGPFMIYRYMKWWPYIDYLATYGHLFNNFTIIYVAINYGVNLYMCFNVVCVCLFYCLATIRLNRKAE